MEAWEKLHFRKVHKQHFYSYVCMFTNVKLIKSIFSNNVYNNQKYITVQHIGQLVPSSLHHIGQLVPLILHHIGQLVRSILHHIGQSVTE